MLVWSPGQNEPLNMKHTDMKLFLTGGLIISLYSHISLLESVEQTTVKNTKLHHIWTLSGPGRTKISSQVRMCELNCPTYHKQG